MICKFPTNSPNCNLHPSNTSNSRFASNLGHVKGRGFNSHSVHFFYAMSRVYYAYW
jgi:hypothetical protein